jgi:nucleotide-binding universal stress UspA family protein
MTADERPVIVAYDGSAESQAAVRAAATLFPSRTLVVITVWEPGLALAMAAQPDQLSGVGYYPPPSAETVTTMDAAQRDHAADLAAAGAALARELGATVETHAVPDELNIADTVASVAEERDAAAVVVGSRGLGRIKSRLLGSTSQGLLHHVSRPVVVVRAPE